jgi:exodeoxyribonuclease (lambda-induced)
MKTYKDILQGTPEWLEVRKGKMTASHAQAIGNNGKGLHTYVHDLMADSFSSGEYESYSNKHMDRGNELEDQARTIYELETDQTVEQVGFIDHDAYSGCSPDGLVDDDGMIEIKCMDDKKHFRVILYGEKEIDSKYIWQMQMQMLVADRKWVDFIAYNPNFKQSLIIHRIKADKDTQDKILEGIATGTALIKQINIKLTKQT